MGIITPAREDAIGLDPAGVFGPCADLFACEGS